MIPLIGTGKVKQVGFMRRCRGTIIPAISPAIQGANAYNLLTDEQRGLLRYALKDAARIHKCKMTELQWAFGKNENGVAPLSIKPVKRIEL